jgi:alpha-tubulin suppressor-like RCC1 family protein
MSQRYLAGFVQAGLFNPLAAPTPSGYTYELWSWGANGGGQLGLGNLTNYSSPKQVGSLTTWLNIAAGYGSVLATKSNGTLWSWGQNNNGQLGLGDVTNRSSPVQVGALTTWLKITTGQLLSIATRTDGTLWAWGATLGAATSSPVQVGALTTWANVACSNQGAALVTKTDGTLWAWGTNADGQLGLGDVSARNSPVQVGSLTTWSNVTCGNQHTIATKTDGTIWAWGLGTVGQLGLGVQINYSSPKQVGALTTWLNIAGGYLHTLATKTSGALWVWGANYSGQLGIGTSGTYNWVLSPVQVGALTTWSGVSGGGTNIASSFSAATKTDGTLWSWGINTSGQLGLGNTTAYSSPKQVGSLTTWSKLAALSTATIALKY